MMRVKINRSGKNAVEYAWAGETFPRALELAEVRGERLALLEYRMLTVDKAGDGTMVASYGPIKAERGARGQ